MFISFILIFDFPLFFFFICIDAKIDSSFKMNFFFRANFFCLMKSLCVYINLLSLHVIELLCKCVFLHKLNLNVIGYIVCLFVCFILKMKT